jgi:hypothetical protein
MPSGKQVSFSYGEVSKSLYFKSNAVSYVEGLAQLTNGFVRDNGGVSNRVGFKYLATLETNVTYAGLENSQQKSRLLPVAFDTGDASERLLGKTYNFRWINPTFKNGVTPVSNGTFEVYDRNGLLYPNAGDEGSLLHPIAERSVGGDPRKVQIHTTSFYTFLTFGEINSTIKNYMYSIESLFGIGGGFYRRPYTSQFTDSSISLSPGALTGVGSAPLNIPVTYLVTAEFTDGLEKFMVLAVSGSGGHPHPTLSTSQTFTVAAFSLKSVKRFNFYRAVGTLGSAFSKVGAIAVTDDNMASFTFKDFVVVGDISDGPPINSRLWGFQYGSAPPTTYTDLFDLRDALRVMTYQQRLFVAYGTNTAPTGTIGVSKLGVPQQFHGPDVYNSVDSFDFKLPLRSGDVVLHMVPMDRALIFSNTQIIMLRGSGDHGYISPTEVNPSVIWDGGISPNVTPAIVTDRCFFVSADHRKIYQLQVKDNQYGIIEISSMSEHLLDKDILEIQTTLAQETILWILRRDGKLVSVTVGEESYGFSLHETDGRITSIGKFNRPLEYRTSGEWLPTEYSTPILDYNRSDEECLAAQVLRDVNGQTNLYLESLVPRIDADNNEEGFTYADSFKTFGSKLALNQNGKYVSHPDVEDPLTTAERIPFNIQEGTTYEAGDPCVLFTDTEQSAAGTVGGSTLSPYVDFYYDETSEDEYGDPIIIKRYLRFVKNGTPTWNGVDEYRVPGYFESQVPAELIDVESQNPSNKLALQTRYCLPIKTITGLTHLAGREVSVYADGEVISSPNNPDPDVPTLTVSVAGELDLGQHYGYATVGLPYTTTIQSLDLEASDARTLTSGQKNINAIGVAVENTRGGYFGSSGAKLDITKFEKLRAREDESLTAPERNFSGYIEIPIQSSWDTRGRAVIKQVDPLPISILSIYPKGVTSGE